MQDQTDRELQIPLSDFEATDPDVELGLWVLTRQGRQLEDKGPGSRSWRDTAQLAASRGPSPTSLSTIYGSCPQEVLLNV